MRIVRWGGWAGLAVSGAVVALGLMVAIGSAISAGDWLQAPEPWIGIGMSMLVVGLAGVGLFGLLLDVVEPIGWWRGLAIPPALVVGSFWAFVLLVGVPTTGGPDSDVATVLYSLPSLLLVLLIATCSLPLPAAIGRLHGSGLRPR